MSDKTSTPTYSTQWAADMAAASEQADAAFGEGDTFAPHDGAESDLNQHGADMLAEGDSTWDPTSPDYIANRGA